MSTISLSPVTPDDFEKMVVRRQSPSPRRPSITASEDDWYLNKRKQQSHRRSSSSGSSSQTRNPSTTSLPISHTQIQPEQYQNDKITKLHPSIEISLAILTSGLSVAAFHAVKSISDRKAAKKARAAATAASQRSEYDLSRQESMLVPSSIVARTPVGTEMEAEPILELEGSPMDLPSVYSVGGRRLGVTGET